MNILILLSTVFLVSISSISGLENNDDCQKSTIQASFLFDITTSNVTDFTNLQNRLIETIRHIETVAVDRKKHYSVTAFHRLPVVLTHFKSSQTSDVNKVIKQIESLTTRRHMENSPANALMSTADQIARSQEKDTKNVVFLAHDGMSTDGSQETEEAIKRIVDLNATIFVISGAEDPNKLALVSYTKDRRRVYSKFGDRANFFKTLDKILGVCKIKASFSPRPKIRRPITTQEPKTTEVETIAATTSASTPKSRLRQLSVKEKTKLEQKAKKFEAPPKVFGLRTAEAAENIVSKMTKKFSQDQPCASEKVDLMIVIDTSSSVFNAFHDELQLAQDFVNGLHSNSFDKAVQIGLVQFSIDASVVLPLESGHQRKEIINKIRQIEFTGKSTRIADAVERALGELEVKRRKDAIQIFVLISDGHGQEFWHRVQATGKRLQNSGAEIFAATTSHDYNYPELLIYAGDESRIFVGLKEKEFVPSVSAYINKCITNGSSSETSPKDAKKVLTINKINDTHVAVEEVETPTAKKEEAKEDKNLSSSTEKPENKKDDEKPAEKSEQKKNIVDATPQEDKSEESSSSTNTGKEEHDNKKPEKASTKEVERLEKLTDLKTDPTNAIPKQDIIVEKAEKTEKPIDEAKNDTSKEDQSEKATSNEKSSEIDTLDQHGPLKEPTRTTVKQLHEVLKSEPKTLEKSEELSAEKEKSDLKEDSEKTLETPEKSSIEGEKETSEKSNEKEENTPKPKVEKDENSEKSDKPSTPKVTLEVDPKKESQEKPLLEETPETTTISLSLIDHDSDKASSSSSEDIKNLKNTTTLSGDAENTTALPEDKLEGQKSKTSAPEREKNKAVADGGPVQDNNKTSDAKTDPFSAPNLKEMVHEAIQKAEIMEKFLNNQNIVPESIPCQTDIVFVIDRAQKPSFVYEQQIQLIKDLVLKIMPEDIDSKKVRLSAVTFSQKPHLLVSLDSNHAKNGFLEALETITPSEGVSSIAQAVRRTVIEIMLNRRESSRLITIIATDGINNDAIAELEKSINDLIIFPKSEAYVVSLNPEYNFSVLQALTGNKWKVYVDARVRKFVAEVGHSLKVCEIPAEETKSKAFIEDGEHEPTSEVEKVEHLQIAGKSVQGSLGNCNHDPVDIVIVLDLSTSVSDDFDEQKLVAMHLLKQAPESDYVNRVRVGLVTFSSGAQLAIPLNTARSRDDLLYAFDRIEHTGGQTSVVSGLFLAISEIQRNHRPEARLVLILMSDGNSRDEWPRVTQVGEELDKVVPERYAITLSPDSNERELMVYAGDEKRVFNQNTVQRFLFDSRLFFTCSQRNGTRQENPGNLLSGNDLERVAKALNESESEGQEKGQESVPMSFNMTIPDSGSKKEMNATFFRADEPAKEPDGRPSNAQEDEKKTQKADSEKEGLARGEIKAADQPIQDSMEKLFLSNKIGQHRNLLKPTYTSSRPPIAFLSDECKVDLMFIIDTSQSVANEFQQQLQFAVDLVKRLPTEDFEHRVQVSAVSFNNKAKLEFPFGQLLKKEDVLDALLKIGHHGGSTSAASGVALAIEEMQRARRPDARLMVVLVSDGNSQDYWDRVVFESNRLREIKADVYAVTVSKDYFFRELELYAGNKWFVYIDARIRQFLDEAEMSLVQCVNPTIPRNDVQSTTTVRALLTSSTTASSTTSTAAPSTSMSAPSTSKITPSTTASTTRASTASSTSSSAETTKIASPATIFDATEQDFTTVGLSETSASSLPSTTTILRDCTNDIIDLVFILDTSTSVEQEFYAEKNFALDLIKVLPEADFKDRIRVALTKFHGVAKLQFPFLEDRTRDDILYDIERVEHTGGQTSLVHGTEVALEEIKKNRRPHSRLVTIIISDGNSQDDWNQIQMAAKRLRETGSEIYAVTLSSKYYFDELKEYTGNEKHVYINDKVDKFIQEVGQSVVSCPGRWVDHVTMAPTVQASATPTTKTISSSTLSNNLIVAKSEDEQKRLSLREDFAKHDALPIQDANSFNLDKISTKCKIDKMDLIIILDASTSREGVFEHQRELALSLIERLPISKDDTHVAVGINSFTNTPTLRQHLGLGREKEMVRHAIEGIEYRGGSTLTSKAVELAVEDLERGRRPDAKQVVVLMNDGMSQDPWDKVVSASRKLASTGAERFGVALGKEIDLREIRLYIENENRIYKDGETERFLSDVVSLLTGGSKDCEMPEKTDVQEPGFLFNEDACSRPKLDLVVLFDNHDNTPDLTDPRVVQDRYLLLDVLGSLSTGDDIKVAVYSFTDTPQLKHRFSDPQDRDSLFEKIESIQPKHGTPSYSKAVHQGLSYYNQNKRPDARGLLLIVGDGQSRDSFVDKNTASDIIKSTSGLSCYAVDTNKNVDVQSLSLYTGSPSRVYNYDRNADFARELMNFANAGKDEKCQEDKQEIIESSSGQSQKSQTYSTPPSIIRQRDIAISSMESKERNRFRVEKIIGQRQNSIKRLSTTKTIFSTTVAPRRSRLQLPNLWSNGSNSKKTKVNQTSASPRTKNTTDCPYDLFIILDTSNKNETSLRRQKVLAKNILVELKNIRLLVTLIKATSSKKSEVVFSNSKQPKEQILQALEKINLDDGSTNSYSPLQQVSNEVKNNNQVDRKRILIIFSDGFTSHVSLSHIISVRKLVPFIYAINLDSQTSNSRSGLERIDGDKSKIFLESNIEGLQKLLIEQFKRC